MLFSTTKLQHAYGLGNNLSFPLHFGATAVLSAGPPKPDTLLAVLRERRPTIFFSVPALYGALVRARGRRGRVRARCGCASRPPRRCRPTIFDRFRDRFGLEIVDGIGSTEMLHIFCSNVPGAVVRGSTGRPVPGYELRIVDEDGGVLPARRSATSRSAATAARRSTGTSTRRRRRR